MIITKTEVSHNSFLFELEDVEEVSILRRVFLVNGYELYMNDDKEFRDIIDIVFTKEFTINSKCDYRVYYHLDDGEERFEELSFAIKMPLPFPVISVDNINISGPLRISYTLFDNEYYNDEGLDSVSIVINDINIGSSDGSLISSSVVNDIDFILKFSAGDVYKVEYKALRRGNEVLYTQSWALLKEVKCSKVRRFSKVSYLSDGEVTCSFRKSSEKVFNITENESVFMLNDYSLQIMFLLFEDANVHSYKVEFNDLLIN